MAPVDWDIINDVFSSWWAKALAAAPFVVAVIIAALRIFNGLYQLVKNYKASKLEKKISKTTGVTAYTASEIENACRSYIEPNCTSTDPSDEDDLRNVVALAPLFRTVDDHFARGGERRHIILLADSGMGKTSFCINYYAREQKKRVKNRRKIGIVPLGSGDPISQINNFENQNETILFLDAFDEDPSAVSNPYDRLRHLMSVASKFRNVVVTCRSQFFENDDSIPKGSGIMYAAARKAGIPREFPLHKLFLAPFNEQQVKKYLVKNFSYSSLSNIHRRRQAAKLVGSIPELSVRPMLLELVPDLIREKREVFQLFELYDYLIESWLRRERDWINENDLRAISVELAVVIFVRQRQGLGDRISAETLEEIASEYNSSIATWKLKSRSLLNRDIVGNFKFAHRSVMEFLVVLASLKGDKRALSVEWTDLMKDLLVSLANTSAESEERTIEFLKNDLSATKVFPLANSVDGPRRLSLSECKRALRNENISVRHSRRIPVAWRNTRYDVKCVAKTSEVASYLIGDQTHGLSWMINDVSGAKDPTERELYVDRFVENRHAGQNMHDILGASTRLSYRYPSIVELITLWECESYLCQHFGIRHIFDPTGIYWVGDKIEENYICASFGSEPYLQSELKPIDARFRNGKQKFHLYELVSKYGMVNRMPYRAFSALVIEDVFYEQQQIVTST